MVLKHILPRLGAGLPVVSFAALLLGLSHFSYHIRELLVCWFFLSLLFAVLALSGLGILLAGYSGLYLVRCVRAAATVAPELLPCPVDLQPEAILGPPILLAGTLEIAANHYATTVGFEANSGQSTETAPSMGGGVLK